MRSRLFVSAAVMAGLVVVMPAAALAGDTPAAATETTAPSGPRGADGRQPVRCDSIGFARLQEPTAPKGIGRAVLDAVPKTGESRVLPPSFADFPARPSLALEVVAANDIAVVPNVEAPGLASAVLGETKLVATTNGAALQILGSTTQTGRDVVPLSVRHSLQCEGATELRMTVLPEGVALAAVDEQNRSYPIAWAGTPWALDATGKELRTWYEVDGSILRQHIDATGAVAPITFDPTYSFLNCFAGHFSDITAYWYLNIHADDADYCPVMGMFTARTGYRPVFAFETNVANDYGKIIVNQNGGCSFARDTGASFDFQVPCKAHDYCYDLRKAGFSGTVSDSDCDAWFYWLMEAHCNNRVLINECRSTRDQYFAAVSAPGVVTDPDPASVSISNFNSAQCIDVEGSSTSNNARILQWPCGFTSNQLWKITPADGEPGLFRLKNKHSGKCLDTWQTGLTQWSCQYTSQLVQIRGAFNLNEYTIRSKDSSFSKCVDVPFSSQTAGEQLITYSCFETDNQLWFVS
jgi:hypothetical protein